MPLPTRQAVSAVSVCVGQISHSAYSACPTVTRGRGRMNKVRGMVAVILFGWALWAVQGAVGQEQTLSSATVASQAAIAAGAYNDIPFPAGPPHLFTAATDAASAALVEPSAIPSVPRPHSGRRAVQIDFARLGQAHEALAEGRSAELTANLPDLPLPVVLTRTSDTRSGYALSGRVANDPFSAVNIVVNGRSVAGNIRRRGKLHTIRSAGAGYYVQTLDSSTLPRCELDQLGEWDRDAAERPSRRARQSPVPPRTTARGTMAPKSTCSSSTRQAAGVPLAATKASARSWNCWCRRRTKPIGTATCANRSDWLPRRRWTTTCGSSLCMSPSITLLERRMGT